MQQLKPTVTEVRETLEACKRRGMRVLRRLGEGGFGTVQEVEMEDGARRAVKVVRPGLVLGEYVQREVQVQRQMEHPNVVRLYDVVAAGECLALVMEKGDLALDAYLESFGDAVPESIVRYAYYDVFNGLKAIHDRGFAHRDIKEENVLLFRNPKSPWGYTAKIADFGLVKNASMAESLVGTFFYQAPEIDDGEYNHKVDIWAAGIMLDNVVEGTLMVQLRRGKQASLIHAVPEESKRGYSDELCDLIERCLTRDPAQRISADEALKHPFFAPLFKSAGSKFHMVFVGNLRKSGIGATSPCVLTADVLSAEVRSDGLCWKDLWDWAIAKRLFRVADAPVLHIVNPDTLAFIFAGKAYGAGDRVTADDGNHTVLVFSSEYASGKSNDLLVERRRFKDCMRRVRFDNIARKARPSFLDERNMMSTLGRMQKEIETKALAPMNEQIGALRELVLVFHAMNKDMEKVWEGLKMDFAMIREDREKLSGMLKRKKRSFSLPAVEGPDLLCVGRSFLEDLTDENGEFEFHGMDAYHRCVEFVDQALQKGRENIKLSTEAQNYGIAYDMYKAVFDEAKEYEGTFNRLLDYTARGVAEAMKVKNLFVPIAEYERAVQVFKDELSCAVGGRKPFDEFLEKAEGLVLEVNRCGLAILKDAIVIRPRVGALTVKIIASPAPARRAASPVAAKRRPADDAEDVDVLKREIAALKARVKQLEKEKKELEVELGQSALMVSDFGAFRGRK